MLIIMEILDNNKIMKKYMLFEGLHYYPSGGFGDFKGTFDTIEEAISFIAPNEHDIYWSHIVETESGQKVWEQN